MFRVFLYAKGQVGEDYLTYEDMVYDIMKYPTIFIKANYIVTDTWNKVIGFWEEE